MSACEPLLFLNGDPARVINPCGLVAWSNFNDSYQARTGGGALRGGAGLSGRGARARGGALRGGAGLSGRGMESARVCGGGLC
jgi:hypothetical protein